MRLWSLQNPEALEALGASGVVRAEWSRVNGAWLPAYQVMVHEMERNGIACDGHPPIWAWIGTSSPEAVKWVATLLLSDIEWQRGIVIVDLEVPDGLVLLSSYGHWNEMFYVNFEGIEHLEMDWTVPPLEYPDSVQACIPELRAAWISSIRPLGPKPT